MGYRRILVIRLSSIGDIVVTTAAIRCLKKTYPDALIDVITKQRFQDVLAQNPYINRVLNYEEINAAKIKPERYDLLVDFQANLRSRLLCRKFGKAELIRVKKPHWDQWKLVRFKRIPLFVEHISTRYFESLKRIGVVDDNAGLDFFNLGTLNPSELPTSPFVVAGLGGTYATKKMPPGLWIDALNATGLPVVLTGGPAEQEAAKFIQEGLNVPCLNACGKWTLAQSATALSKAAVVISHDTGIMHMAAALKKPLVSIWGNTVPAFGLYPLFPSGMENKSVWAQVEGLSCRPCSKLGKSTCPKGHFSCMAHQNTAFIAQEAIKLAHQ